MSTTPCQIHGVGQIARPIGVGNTRRQLKDNIMGCSQGLQPGDLVRVRSAAEIQATLNKWHQLKGCRFLEEMRPYCNTIQRVFKRVEKFLDEREYLMKKTQGIIILEKVFCRGSRDLGACDRTCFFFWREEWLEKMGMSLPETPLEGLLAGSANERRL